MARFQRATRAKSGSPADAQNLPQFLANDLHEFFIRAVEFFGLHCPADEGSQLHATFRGTVGKLAAGERDRQNPPAFDGGNH